MPSEPPVEYIDIRVLIHATEDVQKVVDAVHNTLPKELPDQVTFKRTDLRGHHKNPITLLETRIEEEQGAQEVFKNLASNLNGADKNRMKNEIDHYIKKRELFIRLDKQSAYRNQLKLNATDPIHLRIRFGIYFQKSIFHEVVNICREYGLLPE